jgi:hypothetical protein
MTDDPETPAAETPTPIRPVREYEDIAIREISIGFSCGVQDLTLYPEDTMETDASGNIRITFPTMGGGEFVAYAGHMQFHSYKEVSHRRVKGSLRPDPKQMMRDFKERQTQEELRRTVERAMAEAVQD